MPSFTYRRALRRVGQGKTGLPGGRDPLQMARLQLERGYEAGRRRRTSGPLSFLVARRTRASR